MLFTLGTLFLFSDFNAHYLRAAVMMTAAVAGHTHCNPFVFKVFIFCYCFFNRTTLGNFLAKKVSQPVDNVEPENLVEKSMQWNPWDRQIWDYSITSLSQTQLSRTPCYLKLFFVSLGPDQPRLSRTLISNTLFSHDNHVITALFSQQCCNNFCYF